MVTAVVIDGMVHIGHPEKKKETFCGKPYSIESADRIASFAMYVDDVMAQVTAQEDAKACDECIHLSAEFGTPDEY